MRFACQSGCTKCCQTRGFVYLSEEDLVRAAAFVGMATSDFEAKYVIRYQQVLRFRKPLDAQCHFLTSEGCSIHPAKPTQCRLYPFWPEFVETQAAWKEEGRRCPGIGQGDLIQVSAARSEAKEMTDAYPWMYRRLK